MQAAYFLVVAFDNITNPQSNWVFVQGVLSLDGVFENSGFEWRAINANWFHVVAYIGLIAMETLTGILLTWAGVVGLKNATNRTGWGNAQRLTMLGATTGLLVFFFGFTPAVAGRLARARDLDHHAQSGGRGRGAGRPARVRVFSRGCGGRGSRWQHR